VQRNFDNGEGDLGLIGTLTSRALDSASSRFLRSNAITGGLQGRRRFGGGKYFVRGYVFGSRTAGDRRAILRAETSFVHLYQRPDVRNVSVDSNATALSGAASELWISKNDGGTSRWGVAGHVVTPGFDINDVGFQGASNYATSNAWLGRQRVTPTEHTLNWSSFINWFSMWPLNGPGRFAGFIWWNHVAFKNYWTLDGSSSWNLPGDAATALRGGPAMYMDGNYNYFYDLSTDPRSALSWIFHVNGSLPNHDGFATTNAGPGITWRPSGRAELQLAANAAQRRNPVQYVATVSNERGRHYLIGDLRQRTASMTARASVAFSPNLTLQTYMQPFVSSGHYSSVSEVVRPREHELSKRVQRLDRGPPTGDGQPTFLSSTGPLPTDEPDFFVADLNVNTVLRWEFRAGSTLYVVWTQARHADGDDGHLTWSALGAQVNRAAATNVLLAKLTYHLGR
jgi:hypothetical protein